MALMTPVGIASFCSLFVPKEAMEAGKDPRFSTVLLLDMDAQATPEYKALKAAVLKAADEKFGAGKSADMFKNNQLRSPFRKTSEKDFAGYDIENGIFMSAWTLTKPGVVGPDSRTDVVPSDLWAGCKIRMTVNPFAYSNQGNKGVAFGLSNVQLVSNSPDLPRLDGRKAASAEFDSIDTPEDQTEGGGDDAEDDPF